MTQTLTTTDELKHLASSDNTNELTRSLARECLANREAQPVGFYTTVSGRGGVVWHNGAPEDDTAIYTAPPAPAVPEAISTRQAIANMERHELCGSINVAYKHGWNACRAAMLAQPVSQGYKLPMQPLVIDTNGALRFKQNPIVRRLLDYATENGYGLNEIAMEQFEADDQMQLAQLIGYSLSGYGTLSYVTDESYDRAAAAAPEGGNG